MSPFVGPVRVGSARCAQNELETLPRSPGAAQPSGFFRKARSREEHRKMKPPSRLRRLDGRAVNACRVVLESRERDRNTDRRLSTDCGVEGAVVSSVYGATAARRRLGVWGMSGDRQARPVCAVGTSGTQR